MKFYSLNVVISLSDWTPDGEFFGIHKSSVSSKGLLKINPSHISLQIIAHPNTSAANMLMNLCKSTAYICYFMLFQNILVQPISVFGSSVTIVNELFENKTQTRYLVFSIFRFLLI